MKSLVLRIYIALVAVLLLFALASGWMVSRHFEAERERARQVLAERTAAWADLARSGLPGPQASAAEQAEGLEALARQLRVPIALEDAAGARVATSEAFARRERDLDERRAEGRPYRRAERWREAAQVRLALGDGRTLVLWRLPRRGGPPEAEGPGPGAPGLGPMGSVGPGGPGGPGGSGLEGMAPAPMPFGLNLPGPPLGAAGGLALLLAALFVAVALAAWPVARRLTRRLEALQRGVEAFGDGALAHRVPVEGRDEVSALARSFNRAADRIEGLVTANRQLLANASHELRSPLARLKMAVSLLEASPPGGEATDAAERRARLNREVHANIEELDAMVEEVLLASRLDAGGPGASSDDRPVDWLAQVQEEVAGARADAQAMNPPAAWAVDGPVAPTSAGRPVPVGVRGDERLLRRAVRNLLQNARRYGGSEASVALERQGALWVLSISDRGSGVPAEWCERIFEPFFRLPGHAEFQGGVGLGLSLVRQIARRHGGEVRCEARPGGGSVFRLSLPAA